MKIFSGAPPPNPRDEKSFQTPFFKGGVWCDQYGKTFSFRASNNLKFTARVFFFMRYHVLVLTLAVHYDLFYIDIMVISISTWSNGTCEHFSELKCPIWHCDAHIISWQSHRIVKSSFIYSFYVCFLHST